MNVVIWKVRKAKVKQICLDVLGECGDLIAPIIETWGDGEVPEMKAEKISESYKTL